MWPSTTEIEAAGDPIGDWRVSDNGHSAKTADSVLKQPRTCLLTQLNHEEDGYFTGRSL